MRIVVCSQFFLDAALWRELAHSVLTPMLKEGGALRVWSAGCHSGKEPYSMAMLLDELAPGKRHAILATDIDAAMLQVARAGGPYTHRDVETLTPEQLTRYFTGGPPFFVSNDLQSRVEFQTLDLRADRYDCGFDVILFRDVEPFFTFDEKQSVYQKFHAALRPGGVVFTGAVERLASPERIGFRRVAEALYQKVA